MRRMAGEPRLSEPKEKAEAYSSRIVLNFMRHSERAAEPPAGESGDNAFRLTPAGREKAKSAKQFRAAGDISQAVAFGSPRKRTQETAGFVMAGEDELASGSQTLEELKKNVDRALAKGSKIGVDLKLDFPASNEAYSKRVGKAFADGKFVDWLVNESDKTAKELGETTGPTYNRLSKNVAEIVEKYLAISPRFETLAQDPKKKYQKTLERFFGTHQSVGEAFLAKVIEKTKGKNVRDEFIRAIQGKGFDFVEGFQIEIDAHGKKEATVQVTFEKKDEAGKTIFEFRHQIDKKILDEIIKEGNV